MAIRKRGNTWQIDYFDPDGKRVRKSFKAKKEAELELAARITAIDDGSYREKSVKCTTRLKEMIDLYAERYGSQSYFKTKQGFLKEFSRFIGENVLISRITYADLDRFRNHLEATPTFKGTPHEKTTINRKLSAISQLFRYAVNKGLIRKNPLSDKESLRFTEKCNRYRWLTKEEIQSLLAECHDRDLFRRVAWSLNTGMDHEDIQRLRWKDIQKEMIWTYRSKLVRDGSKNWSQIPINNEVKAILKEIRREQGLCPPDTPIFERKSIYNGFKAVVKRAGLYSPNKDDTVTFKTLRHTFGSHLAMQGRHPKEIADLMLHKTIDQTMTYMHLSPNQKKEAVHSLDGLTGLSHFVTQNRQEACQY